ncbi:hypothetical protein ACFSHQ_02870 [Gemmobacter lanyuensis]
MVATVRARAMPLPEAGDQGAARVLLTQAEPLELLLNLLACWSRGLVPVILREGRTAESIADLCRFLHPAARMDGAAVTRIGPQVGRRRPAALARGTRRW